LVRFTTTATRSVALTGSALHTTVLPLALVTGLGLCRLPVLGLYVYLLPLRCVLGWFFTFTLPLLRLRRCTRTRFTPRLHTLRFTHSSGYGLPGWLRSARFARALVARTHRTDCTVVFSHSGWFTFISVIYRFWLHTRSKLGSFFAGLFGIPVTLSTWFRLRFATVQFDTFYRLWLLYLRFAWRFTIHEPLSTHTYLPVPLVTVTVAVTTLFSLFYHNAFSSVCAHPAVCIRTARTLYYFFYRLPPTTHLPTTLPRSLVDKTHYLFLKVAHAGRAAFGFCAHTGCSPFYTSSYTTLPLPGFTVLLLRYRLVLYHAFPLPANCALRTTYCCCCPALHCIPRLFWCLFTPHDLLHVFLYHIVLVYWWFFVPV